MAHHLSFWEKNRITIYLAVPGVLIALCVTWWFFFAGPSPALRHSTYLRPDTSVRVALCPPYVQSYVSSLAPTATRFIHGIPKITSMQAGPISFDWIHKMPLEMAFLLDQPSPNHMGVILFICQNPTGESIETLINTSSFLNDLRPIKFSGNTILNDSGGKLRAEGVLDIPTGYQEIIAKMWTQYMPIDKPEIRGNHFIDVGINNRAGALAEIQGACLDLVVPWADYQLQQNLLAAFQMVLEVRLTGDLLKADELGFQLTVDFTDAGSASSALAVVQMASDALATYITGAHGFRLSGNSVVNGNRITGTYSLTGFESKLRRALGG